MENIVFDLGNVIIDIDFSLTYQALAKLSADGYSAEEIAEVITDQGIWSNYEKGLLKDSEFRKLLRSSLSLQAHDSELDNAFCAMLLPIDPKRIALIKRLAKKYQLFILSNTNHIHFKRVEKMIIYATGVDIIEDELIECAFLSYEMGMVKPDKEIYQQMMDEAMILPRNTLFLDDMLPNLETAEKLGIRTKQIIPNQFTILDYAKKVLKINI